MLRFGARDGGPPATPRRGRTGARWIPADDATPELRYRDPTQMGKVYLLPAGVERPVPGAGPDEMGPDADDPSLTLEVWRDRIRRHPGELKNLLRNQEFVAGIGNAYSDEILHAARPPAVAQARDPGARGSRRALRGHARHPGERHRRPARARPADVRDRGPRLPGRPQPRRRGVPAVRPAHHPDRGRRLRHELLPPLPALIPAGKHSVEPGSGAGPTRGRPATRTRSRSRARWRPKGGERAAAADGEQERRPLARPVNAKTLATTYFPERLPSQYLRRWRA